MINDQRTIKQCNNYITHYSIDSAFLCLIGLPLIRNGNGNELLGSLLQTFVGNYASGQVLLVLSGSTVII